MTFPLRSSRQCLDHLLPRLDLSIIFSFVAIRSWRNGQAGHHRASVMGHRHTEPDVTEKTKFSPNQQALRQIAERIREISCNTTASLTTQTRLGFGACRAARNERNQNRVTAGVLNKGPLQSPHKDKAETRGRRKSIPDLSLRSRQDVKLGFKSLRHQGTFEEPPPVSPSLLQCATIDRARTPRNDC